jgi:hypothetical protein
MLIILLVAVAILMIASIWKVYEKAGQPGWAAIIPIYNLYIITKIIGKPGYWTVLMLIPIVNYIFLIWSYNLISKKFGKDVGFTLGLIFLSFIFWPILGFGDAKYEGASNQESVALDDPR